MKEKKPVTIEIDRETFFEECVYNRAAVISDNIVDHRRWYVVHEILFRHSGKVYEASYERPNTENQDVDHPEKFVCTEVEPHEVTKIEYRPVLA